MRSIAARAGSRNIQSVPEAFSLVELSIVLVILGLLVGGILAGQSLIRASELRSVGTDYHRYITAAQAFRDKYFGLPGDMTNATSFWGLAAAGASCFSTAGSGTQTCNGNGDGAASSLSTSNEPFRFWQHLVNAGLIEGVYDGIQHGSTNQSATAANSPAARLAGGYWYVTMYGISAGNGARFAADYSNYTFSVGGLVADSWPATPLITPAEMWNIDTKIDDGMPGQGTLLVFNWPGCTNASSQTDITTTYKLTTTSLQCVPQFRRAL